MRTELAPLCGRRGSFTATFKRTGVAVRNTRTRTFTTPTLLFVDVMHGGKVVTEHLWFKTCAAWQRLALEPGDQVEFTATVSTYQKGYMGQRDDDDLPAPSIDYKLSRPGNVRKLATADPSGQLQLFVA